MLLKTIKAPAGEINIYHDDDGYHAERWDNATNMIVAQSGDHATQIDALAAINACPKCGGDTMLCECVTEWSQE